jgi:hypothetical protein
MAKKETARQDRDNYLRVLGPSLGPLYYALYNEVTWLHAKWGQYRILFAQSQERVELLNRIAGFFFSVIQRALWEDVVLHIARLTDPPQSVGKENLTLLRLAAALQIPALAAEIENLVGQAQADAKFTRAWRNRNLAHLDLDLAMDRATPLPGISRQNIEHALNAIRAVLNRIEGHFFDREVAFALFIAHDDAENLVYYLESAVDTEDREAEKWR